MGLEVRGALKMKAADRISYQESLMTRRKRYAMSLVTFGVIVCLIATLHFGFWAVRNPHTTAPSVEQLLPSVSYNRFSSNHSGVSEARIRALDAAGGWSSDTICEDSDLGLSILELGWRAHYTARRYGWGLLPQDYLAFRTQRSRWAEGAVQIVKKHWRQFLPGRSWLTRAQKREFIFGWL